MRGLGALERFARRRILRIDFDRLRVFATRRIQGIVRFERPAGAHVGHQRSEACGPMRTGECRGMVGLDGDCEVEGLDRALLIALFERDSARLETRGECGAALFG